MASILVLLANLLLCVSLATVNATADNRKEDTIFHKDRWGSESGTWFSDVDLLKTNHQRIASVHMVGCDMNSHLTKLDVGFRDNRDPRGTITWSRHGGYTSALSTVILDLKTDEYITRVMFTEYKAKVGRGWFAVKKDRIGSLSLWTNKEQYKTCGAFNSGDPTHDVTGDSMVLGYFSGTAANAIDSLATNWIPTLNW